MRHITLAALFAALAGLLLIVMGATTGLPGLVELAALFVGMIWGGLVGAFIALRMAHHDPSLPSRIIIPFLRIVK